MGGKRLSEGFRRGDPQGRTGGVVWHALRATAMSWAADGGATEKMLQAYAGHKTAEMSRKYARGADQRRLAAGAVQAIAVPTGERKG